MSATPGLPQAEPAPVHLDEEVAHLLVAVTVGTELCGEQGYRALGLAAEDARRAAALQSVTRGGGDRLADVESLLNGVTRAADLAARPEAERVRALAGNAVRLRGHCLLAAETMSLSNLLPPGRGAEYLRSLALVYWEWARGAEAVALLDRAERLFRAGDEPMEALDTRRLRVLLHAELGDDHEALWLAGSTAPASLSARPWLGARTALTEAFCLAGRADSGDRKEARRALDQGEELAAVITGEAERLHCAWLAGRVRARFKRNGAAEEQLAALVGPAESLWPAGDRCLLRLDLCVCRTASHQSLNLEEVEAELCSTVTPDRAETVIRPALDLVHFLTGPNLPLWEMAAATGRRLRTLFRLAQPADLRPLPFLVPWPHSARKEAQ
jgi:hypothetical protein